MGPTLAQNQNRRTARVSEDDRLRKAIARNRAKQARKPLPTNSRLNTRKLGATALPNSAPTRLSVGRVGHTTMTSSASPATNRAPSMISYGQQTKDTWKDKFYKYGYYSLWIFCLFLLIRLFIADRGIIEYYGLQSTMMNKIQVQKDIIESNKELLVEIGKIKNSNTYQKHIIRDRLGLIARNEYLILFSEETLSLAN